MARRKPVVRPVGRPPVPARLLVFDAAQWIDPAELPPGVSVDEDPSELWETLPADRTDQMWQWDTARKMARSRWHRARAAWCREHGFHLRELNEAAEGGG